MAVKDRKPEFTEQEKMGLVTLSVSYTRIGAHGPAFEAVITLPLDAPPEKRDAACEAWIKMAEQFLALQRSE